MSSRISRSARLGWFRCICGCSGMICAPKQGLRMTKPIARDPIYRRRVGCELPIKRQREFRIARCNGVPRHSEPGDNLSQCDNDSAGVKGCRYLLATWKQDPIPIPNEAVVIGPFEKGGCGAFERLLWPQIRGDYQAQQAPTQEPFAVECVSKNMMASRLRQFMCHQDTEPMDLSKRYGIERSAWHYTCILVQQLGR